MTNESEELTEGSIQTPPRPEDVALTEANAGKDSLVEEQKDYTDYLKAGGRSGITAEFGKPMITGFDDTKTGATAGADRSAGDSATKKSDAADQHNGILDGINSFFRTVGNVFQEATHAVVDTVHRAVDALVNWFHGGDQPEAKEPVTAADLKMPPPVEPKPPYTGEGIKLDIPSGSVTGKAGDSLDSIAAAALTAIGKGSDTALIDQYKQEIAKLNDIDLTKPDSLDGKQLILPGHKSDGTMEFRDAEGTTITRKADGTESARFTDGRQYDKTPDGAGGWKETHTGPRKEDSFELITTKDNKVLIADKIGDTPHEVPPANQAVEVLRRKLDNLANQKIDDPEKRAKFKADMLRFEERASKEHPPLTESEIRKSYKQIERLLTDSGGKPLKADDRIKLAEQAMAQCATPTSIDQGGHSTCNMTTVEARTYTRNPSAALKLVTDVATTGKYTAVDGTQVTVNPAATEAEARNNPPLDGQRSHASMIFQVTAVNLYYQHQPYEYIDKDGINRFVPPGQLEYRQSSQKPGQIPPDEGDRLIDHSTDPPTTVMEDWKKKIARNSPDIEDRAMVDVPVMITGKHDTIYLANEGNLTSDHTGVTAFKDENELRDQIVKAKSENKLPVILKVHSGQEPFLHDSGDGAAGGSGGWHVVSIRDYDAKTGKAIVDNQWGSSADHVTDGGVPVHDLFRATRGPQDTRTEGWPWASKEINVTIEQLQKDVDSNRASGNIDTTKELELLRVKNRYGGLSSSDYAKELGKTVDEAAGRWGTDHTSKDYNDAKVKLDELVRNLPATEKLDLLQKMHDKGMSTDSEFYNELEEGAKTLFTSKHSDAYASKFAAKLKTMTDSMSASDRSRFYNDLSNSVDYSTRWEVAVVENAAGAITDAEADAWITSGATAYGADTVSDDQEAKLKAKFQNAVNKLSEPRRTALLTTLPKYPGKK